MQTRKGSESPAASALALMPPLALAQQLARIEFETAQRMFRIQLAGMKRFLEFQQQFAASRAVWDSASLERPWDGGFQKTLVGLMEAGTLILEIATELQAEATRMTHEMLPEVSRELIDGVEQFTRSMSAASALKTPQQRAA